MFFENLYQFITKYISNKTSLPQKTTKTIDILIWLLGLPYKSQSRAMAWFWTMVHDYIIELLILKAEHERTFSYWLFRQQKYTGTTRLRILAIFSSNEEIQDYIFYFPLFFKEPRRATTRVIIHPHSRFAWNHAAAKTPLYYLQTFYYNHAFKLNLNPFSKVFFRTNALDLLLNFKRDLRVYILNVFKRTYGFGMEYLYGLVLILFVDACLTDDEPLWEPIEWSLVQSWIMIIFIFAWIAENLIVSRYGSYTGRDKRVWFAWYKSFWLIEGYYVINYGVACVFVIVPFYYETNYNLSFVYSWWHWYSRVFFFKFISIYSLALLISYVLQMNVRWVSWKSNIILVILINVLLSYLLYTQFIMTFFAFFTDPIWYQKTRPIDYIQLSHEPARWGWGPAKKDHFTYHGVRTVLWFKNDGPFATSFLLLQTFLFVCLFLLYVYWFTLFRRIYSTGEVPLTLVTYSVSALRQFFYFFMWFYLLIGLSYLINYARFPIELLWTLDTESWLLNLVDIFWTYPELILQIFN